ncbi:alginate lyase [Algibacter marinivivus]|uniref:Alginate lyase n=1 Tax=Algibacter marinivivus TaxID=2100723 RepID=A0A2U2X309_9FLAO|nr:chondroitinase-B domain-containing protein [Algibacter marinivivus]PWH82168.1 alginate lyase [Algibacter marinivivus]
MYKIIFLLLLLFSVSVIGQTTYNITDPEDLENQTYIPGDIIILADGTYNTDARINFVGNGTVSEPITFRSETPGGVVFTGGLKMDIGGDYVIVDGFHWQGGFGASNFIQFRDGTDYANYSTIQNCAINGLQVHADDQEAGTSVKHRWIVLYGTYNNVTNCSFMNKTNAGATVLVELSYNADANRCATVGHTISNNYFYKYEKIDTALTNAGDSETIRIGSSNTQNVNANVTVTNNYFVEADGENEIITNKSKNNIYTNNTFRRCRGSLVLRHGSDAIVDRNYFLGEDVEGTGGIRISDSNHSITNNYIQDCITENSQAKWNNGITFIGGGDNAAVDCNASGLTNGYQKVEGITLSRNSIVNTNAPLFYNEDKGSTDPTGTVSDNLIYFTSGNSNLTDVISGDSPNAFTNMGTGLTYTGNVFTGTMLGATTTGFSEELGINATADGEIFTFSGNGSSDKGADMGSYIPATDDMVGYGVGACFLDNLGASINDGDCTIVVVDNLTVSTLPTLTSEASSNDVTVNANISWTAVSNDAWISINTNSGTGNATVLVSVAENTGTNSRVGTVTFTQDPGGDDIVRTLNVTQEGADLTSLFDLINDTAGGGPVSIHSWSTEFNPSKPEENVYKTLDKINTNSSIWAAQDGAVLGGDYKGDGEYIIYDLGEEYDLDLIQFSTTDKSDPFGYQVWISTTGTDPEDFIMILPISGDLLLTTKTGTNDFNQYEITETARYVKMIGFGRFNPANNRTSEWSTISEIEFYGSSTLSVSEFDLQNKILFYPVPTSDILNIKSISNSSLDKVQVYTLDGRKVIEKQLHNTTNKTSLDTSSLVNGAYIVNLSSDNQVVSKMIVISNLD